jgi:hypothetical protein
LKHPILKISAAVFLITISAYESSAQESSLKAFNISELRHELLYGSSNTFQDTTKPKQKKAKGFSLHGIFLSIGGGLSVPLSDFNAYSNVSYGILGRLEYSSTVIFPFVVGGEVDYFSYGGYDLYKTLHLLNNLDTKILSYGLSIEYTLSRLLNSSYTTPFLALDVKNNIIKREYDDNVTIDELPRKQTKISVGAGAGFTLFVFDFVIKYNYMKTLSNIGVYTKIKFPIIRF